VARENAGAVPPRGVRSDHVSPALLSVLDQLDSPAQIISDLGVTLAQNRLAEALLGAPFSAATRATPKLASWSPGAYELHLPSDGVTIWYVVAPYKGQEIISIQLVRLDT
jgi:hypothetical protein